MSKRGRPAILDNRTYRSAIYFPSLKRGHRKVNCNVDGCKGNHTQNPTEQAAHYWSKIDG